MRGTHVLLCMVVAATLVLGSLAHAADVVQVLRDAAGSTPVFSLPGEDAPLPGSLSSSSPNVVSTLREAVRSVPVPPPSFSSAPQNPKAASSSNAEDQRIPILRELVKTLTAQLAALIAQKDTEVPIAAAAASALPLRGYDIIVVAGQSNASGGGEGPFFDPLASEATDARIFQIGRYGADAGHIIPAVRSDGVVSYDALQHWGRYDFTTVRTMGFAIPFARRYVNEVLGERRAVLIIPAGHGNTSVLKWLGEIDSPTTTPGALLSDTTSRMRSALALSGQNRIVAFLWHQGETDVTLAARGWPRMSPAVYEAKLVQLVDTLRKDFPSSFPFIAGAYAPGWASEGGDTLEAAFEQATRRVAESANPGAYVTAEGLTENAPGDPHFTSASQITLGERYFATWQRTSQ